MSPAYRFHPEFGYFCPTLGFRRKLRVGFTCIVIGLVAGAAGTLVLKAAHDPKDSGALTFARVDDASSGGDAIAAATAEPAVPATTGEKPRPAEGGKSACEEGASVDQTWAYLDGKCVPGRTRKTRATRPAAQGGPLVAVPLGRTAPPPAKVVGTSAAAANASASAAAATSAPERRPQGTVPVALPASPSEAEAAIANPVTVNPVTVKPSEQAAAEPKKAQKTARRPNSSKAQRPDNASTRDARLRDSQASARAYALPASHAYQRAPVEGGGLFGGGGPFGFVFR